MTSKDLVLAALVILFATLALVSQQITMEKADDDFYCMMVDLHRSSPKQGWPDYKGVYEQQCRRKAR